MLKLNVQRVERRRIEIPQIEQTIKQPIGQAIGRKFRSYPYALDPANSVENALRQDRDRINGQIQIPQLAKPVENVRGQRSDPIEPQIQGLQ